MAYAEHPQVRVRLAGSDEIDGLAGHVGHRERRADLRETRGISKVRKAVKEDVGRTLSSIVSNLVRIIPSTPLPSPAAAPALLLTPAEPEKSRKARLNLVSWSTASFPTRASPTKMILSGWLTAMSCRERAVSRGLARAEAGTALWRERA